MGEDKSNNAGWRGAAVDGRPTSELTFRDRFSAFEGVVENRDLISSYVPVRDGGGRVVGVFELYSDVTSFLEGTKAASRRFADISSANQRRLDATAHDNEQRVVDSSNRFLLVVIGLLVLLYAVSLAIVAVGQRIIDRQDAAHEAAVQREMRWHREKMATLSAMAARVSHEVGNPLAAISGLAQQLPAADGRPILDQVQRIAALTRRIAEFAAARGSEREWVDVNAMLRAVCDLVGFDRRLRGTPIAFDADAALPAVEVVPDHLNEVLLGTLQVCAEGSPPTLAVRTAARDGAAAVRIERGGDPVDRARLEPLARRVAAMGGTLQAEGSAVEILLPAPASV
jgi:signal transduction histidine kinase